MNKTMAIILMMGLMTPLALAGTMTLYPVADAYIDNYYSNTNFNTVLRAGHFDYISSSKGIQRSFFKFDLSQIPGTVTDAKFSIDPIGGPVGGSFNLQLYYLPSDSWSENSLTWNNAPTSYGALVDSGLASSGERIEFDIDSIINEQDNILSFVIKGQEIVDNNYIQFFTSEFEAGGGSNDDELYWPYILVTYDESGCNTAADTDCNGSVDRTELGAFIVKWINNQATRDELGQVITAWSLN